MYRAKYVGGCMKYDFLLSWQIQAPAPSGWWFVGDTTDDRVVQPPASTASFSDFASCVSASLAVPAEDFAFDGGKLGIWLNDSPYEDNLAGDDGGNPTWSLQLLEKCPPNLGIEPR
jgi:hypothetical protein